MTPESDLAPLLAALCREVRSLRDEVANLRRVRELAEPDCWPRARALTVPDKAPTGAYVYFIRCLSPDGHIKIGFAKDLGGRLSSIQNGNPYGVDLVAWFWTRDPSSDEERLHTTFKAAAVRGEWFQPVPELLSLVDRIARERRRSVANAMRDQREDGAP